MHFIQVFVCEADTLIPIGTVHTAAARGVGGARGGEICDSHFSAFSAFFLHFLGRFLSVMFKRKHSSGIVL